MSCTLFPLDLLTVSAHAQRGLRHVCVRVCWSVCYATTRQNSDSYQQISCCNFEKPIFVKLTRSKLNEHLSYKRGVAGPKMATGSNYFKSCKQPVSFLALYLSL